MMHVKACHLTIKRVIIFSLILTKKKKLNNQSKTLIFLSALFPLFISFNLLLIITTDYITIFLSKIIYF